MQTDFELDSLSDAQLVSLAREGDNSAFGQLVQRHRQKCIGIAGYFLRNRSDAEDEAQNAFIKAYQHLDQYQNEAEFSTWLSRIVTNQCLMALRVRRRARFVYLDQSPAERRIRPMELASPCPDPEGALAAVQMNTLFRAEMRRMPPLLRNVMVLRDVRQLRMVDAARMLGITVQAAKSRLMRARLEMRNRLARKEKCSASGKLSSIAALSGKRQPALRPAAPKSGTPQTRICKSPGGLSASLRRDFGPAEAAEKSVRNGTAL